MFRLFDASDYQVLASVNLALRPMLQPVFKKLFEDYDRAVCAGRIVELVDRFLPDHEPHDAVFRLVRIAYDESERPIEACDTVMAADRYVLSYELPAR